MAAYLDVERGHGQPGSKWEGKACAQLFGPKPEQVWPFLEDFFGLGKWFPTLSTCIPVEGVSGQPGCVRFCSGFKTPVDESYYLRLDKKRTVNWTKQKLLSINPTKMIFVYAIVDGNVGFESYSSRVSVVPGKEGCSIEWEYEVEPVKGWSPEDLDEFISSGLRVMAERMEEALAQTN